MDSRAAIQLAINTGHFVCNAYLKDLSDADLMRRAAPGVNHINWQVGHLVFAEHHLVEKCVPGVMPPLPPGFAEKYGKENAGVDDPERFERKETLLRVWAEQRAGTLQALATLSDADLDKPSGVEYAPTFGAIFSLQGSHWLMHCGQWSVVRRQLGLPTVI